MGFQIEALEALEALYGTTTSKKKATDSSDLKTVILEGLKAADSVRSMDLAVNVSHDEVVSAMKSLEAEEQVVSGKESVTRQICTAEGEAIVKKGMSPEVALWNAIPKGGVPLKEFQAQHVPKKDKKAKNIFGQVMKNIGRRRTRKRGC